MKQIFGTLDTFRTNANNKFQIKTKRSSLYVNPQDEVKLGYLATMADLHRAGRYDRMSDDVLTLTGQEPLSVQEFVRKNAATFTAPAKAA